MKLQKSFHLKDDVNQKWFVVDATDQVLGRLASQIATIIRGKHKAIFTPSVDAGDVVVVINAEKIKITGNKASSKMYYRHSGYAGGLKAISFKDLIVKNPERVICHAVEGMLPKNRLAKKLVKHVKVYAGNEHPHQAQNPEVLVLQGGNK
ncbi:MAG: 50S ribosomal protein L13 [Candidatus Margulisiibacteriota bacterium]